MSKIKNGGLDQYGAEPFEQRQLGTAGAEGVKLSKAEPVVIMRPSTTWTDFNCGLDSLSVTLMCCVETRSRYQTVLIV